MLGAHASAMGLVNQRSGLAAFNGTGPRALASVIFSTTLKKITKLAFLIVNRDEFM